MAATDPQANQSSCPHLTGCLDYGLHGQHGVSFLSTSWKLLPASVFLLLFKGKMVNRQELVNDSTDKQTLSQVITQQLTGFVFEYNAEVSGQRVWGRGAAACVRRATPLPCRFRPRN